MNITDDIDPIETQEWRDALDALVASHGPQRAIYLLDQLTRHAHAKRIGFRPSLITPYCNTISPAQQPRFPGDLDMEQRLGAIVRWNALAMVVRANQEYGDLGGHISSYASAADLFEVGFNHFFHARTETHGGDLVFFQPHSAPGIYARAFMEGRLSEENLAHYRQEVTAESAGIQGLSSYPHPYLMPDFWQFPTGSMGLGPISAIYQARFMRYMENRALLPSATTAQRKVWGFFGDGEMDEPESIAALPLAARENLDNLTFIINCNLQRLDGPVRGNSRIIEELEGVFTGAGWNVIKVVWGSDWDALFERDHSNALIQAFAQTVDGEFQTLSAKDGRYNRDHFFGRNPELSKLIEGMTDAQIDRLHRGGHDLVKVYAAFHAASKHAGQPTVILAKTMKGFGMGETGQGRMTTHQQKKLDSAELRNFRDRFSLPLTNAQVESVQFYRPTEQSAEGLYLARQRERLGGHLPKRITECAKLPVPALAGYAQFALDAQGKEMSTTMAFVRMLGTLLKEAELGARIVPIVADEARTFGMANLFKQVGIYSPHGQRYTPEDAGSMLYYREDKEGQILEEGITEAGAISSWTAAATAYSTHGQAMLPFYIYYSMFGFQRVGDLIWAAADQRPRGFLIGATSGRTTLSGEGLQHQDGTSHIHAMTIPNCKAYDPAFAGELAVIVDAGMRAMVIDQKDEFYYITAMNENYAQPSLPSAAYEGVLRGMYRFDGPTDATLASVQLLGSGAILTQVVKAAALLKSAFGVHTNVWSVTSFSELARDGQLCERRTRIDQSDSIAWVTGHLESTRGPIIAATDYVRLVPESIRAYLPVERPYITLGTDGFGRSDTRAKLRDYFEVDTYWIALTAALELMKRGDLALTADAIQAALQPARVSKVKPG
jgi:pyruvate dehydrogenase E1 component